MRTLYWTFTCLLNLVVPANFQMSTSGSFFKKTFGDESDRNPDEPSLKPEFFQCDREKSCTNVVRFKSGKYKSVAGGAEMKKIKKVACIWTKYSQSTQNQLEPSNQPEKNKMSVCQGTERALGMESESIPNDRITASTFLSQGKEAYYGRLNGAFTWAPQVTDDQPYIQVDFEEPRLVDAVATQGFSMGWTATYQIGYSNDTANFQLVTEALQSTPVKFSGNTDSTTIVKNRLPSLIVARYLRILLKTKTGVYALRAEFYTCDV